jgi:hypothetical protein
MSISGVGQNYYQNNMATTKSTKNVKSTEKIPTAWRECALPTILMRGKSSKYLMR